MGMSDVPAVFLDRDGTINVDKHYVHRPADWEWIPGAPEAIRRLNDAGYKVVVVSNQSAIARGMCKQEDVDRLHQFVSEALEKIGARVDAYYFCPHHPEFGDKVVCDCRKPKPGLILQAAKDLRIDLGRSWLVGDKSSDIAAAKAAGIKGILVKTGYGTEDMHKEPRPEFVVADLTAACDIISPI